MVKPWDSALIGDFLDFKNGLNKGKEFFGYGTPIVNYTDVYKKRGLKNADIRGRVSLTTDEIRRFDVRRNDVFFTRTSETPDEVGMSSVLLEEIEDCVFSGFVLRGRPKNDMFVPEYCKYCFSTEAVRNAIITGCTYTTRALTNGKQLSAIEIVVPPKPEQEAIAAALSDIDALISNLEKLIAKKKAIKQGAMQELLTGKRRLPGFDGEWGDLEIGENGYLLRECVDPQSFALTLFSEYSMPAYDDGKIPVKVYGADMHSNRTVIYGNVLLFNKLNVRQKRIWLVNATEQNSVCSSEFLPYCSDKIDLRLLAQLLLSENITRDFIGMSTGTSNSQKRITPKDFMEYVTYIPLNIQEQTAIADILSDMDNEVEKLERNLVKFHLIKQGMMNELLTGRIRLIEKEDA